MVFSELDCNWPELDLVYGFQFKFLGYRVDFMTISVLVCFL